MNEPNVTGIVVGKEVYVTGRKLTYSKSTIARNPDLFRVRGLEASKPEQNQRHPTPNRRLESGKEGLAIRVGFLVHCGRPMDRDNLAAALKPLRDAVCESIGIDDHDEGTGLVFEYHQVKSKLKGVIVTIQTHQHITTTETKKTVL